MAKAKERLHMALLASSMVGVTAVTNGDTSWLIVGARNLKSVKWLKSQKMVASWQRRLQQYESPMTTCSARYAIAPSTTKPSGTAMHPSMAIA